MNQTYNPVLEVVELRRLRGGSALRMVAMGTALVMERPVGDPLVVTSGQKPPGALRGYRRMYRIDVATRGLSFTTVVPSSDAAFPFSVTVNFACQVADPAVIARDNVQDMTAALSPSLISIVRVAAARFDVLDTSAAESAITQGLAAAYCAPSVRLSGFSVTVAAVNAAEIVTARREIRVEEMKRDAMRPVASGGRTEMLAHIMATNGGDPTSWIDREQDAKDSHTRAQLDALRVLMGAGEEHNVARIGEQVMGTFFGPEGGSLPRPGIRDRIERKSRGALDSGAPVVEESPDDPKRVSRIRGTAAGEPPATDDGR
jgi:hypothetical protein